MRRSDSRRNATGKRPFGALACVIALAAGTVPGHAGVVCRDSPPIEALSDWEPCGAWCAGEAGMQLVRCDVPRGAMMYFQTGYLVRSAAGTHYVISDGTGQRMTSEYIEACDALFEYCR